MPIARLGAVTIGRIAAGEVIERPVSVVKECVENALDAGATRVAVALTGLEAIEVVDDGAGIAPEELALALERHATSKLRDPEGLDALATLGFRGEGLASVAAVARVRLRSRRAQDAHAFEVEAFEERVGAPTPAAGPVGTTVRAEAFFANVPARREYLRSPQAEAQRVAAFLTTLSLGYPRVAFTLRIDGRQALALPAAARPFDRAAHVFGRDAYERMLEIGEVATGMRGTVRGFVSRPGADRGDRGRQLLFVNGRLLRSTQLAGAWSTAYAGYLGIGRHPYGVVLLELPAGDLDPNVHPTKSDVRFRYAAQVSGAVRTALLTTLREDARRRFGESVALSPTSLPEPAPFDASPPGGAPADAATVGEDARGRALDAADRGDAVLGRSDGVVADEGARGAETGGLGGAASWQGARRVANREDPRLLELVAAPSARLRVLAQLDRAFILASDGRGIVLVDQHAAHERVAYEAIVAAALAAEEGAGAPRQPLLVPELVECPPADAAALESSLAALRAAGVEVELFGERLYRVTAMPAELAARRFDLRAYVEDLDEAAPGLDARERAWASMACHSVVRAGEAMAPEEMQRVVDRLADCANPMHCPHGRPTIVRFDAPAIARLFRR